MYKYTLTQTVFSYEQFGTKTIWASVILERFGDSFGIIWRHFGTPRQFGINVETVGDKCGDIWRLMWRQLEINVETVGD